ncbi:MAG: N-acetyltransferase [Firmicutes bacterium]|nr:N-acetyltransferase [Bacillota bacterium]
MNLTLRLETPNDHRAVEELTREAFWGFTRPTCDEHYLVHLLRNSPALVPELDYVAEADGKLVGHIIYTRAKVIDNEGREHEVLPFGPLRVLPEYWNRGIGSALVRRTIAAARNLGYRAIIIYGHPDYYPRFGFRSADLFDITTPQGTNFDALMALPLYEGALDGITGAFHIDPVFDIDVEAAKAFDRNFPHKEPAHLVPIDVLLKRLQPSLHKAIRDRKITTLAALNRFSGREMLTWEGIDENVMNIINSTLREYGYAEKLLPSSSILKRAELE